MRYQQINWHWTSSERIFLFLFVTSLFSSHFSPELQQIDKIHTKIILAIAFFAKQKSSLNELLMAIAIQLTNSLTRSLFMDIQFLIGLWMKYERSAEFNSILCFRLHFQFGIFNFCSFEIWFSVALIVFDSREFDENV